MGRKKKKTKGKGNVSGDLGKYATFNKVILFTIELYISKTLEEGLKHIDERYLKLRSSILARMRFWKFTQEEVKRLSEYNDDPELRKIVDGEYSFIVFAVELIKLWVENVPKEGRKSIHLGVSDDKLKIGRAILTMDMLKLKMQNKDSHAEYRELINDSAIRAKRFYAYQEKQLLGTSKVIKA